MPKPSPFPAVEIQVVQELLLRTHGMEARQLKKLPGEYDLNIYVEADDSTPFLLKIAPARAERSSLSFQNAMMDHLSESAPDVGIPRVVPGLTGKKIFDIEWEGTNRLMRLLEWLPGKPWAAVSPQDEELLKSLGEKLGKLSRGLEGFDHPSAHRDHEWDIAHTLELVEDSRALFDDPALGHDAHPIGHLAHDAEVVGDQQQRHAELALQLL